MSVPPDPRLIRIDRPREVNMKMMAETVVAFDKKVAAPRAPKAVWLLIPPKAEAISPALPDWSKTTRIKMTDTMT